MNIKDLLRVSISLICFSTAHFAQTETAEQGIKLFQRGDYPAAIKILKKTIKSNSTAEGWMYLGNAYLQQNDLKNAQKALEKAIEIDQTNAAALTGLAYVYVRKDDEEKAAATVTKAITLDKNNCEANYIRGVLSYRDASFNAAYQSAQKAIAANPQFAPAYLLKSESLAQSFGILLGAVSKSPTERAELLTDAASSLETYLKLVPNVEDAAEQRERLKGLQFLAQHHFDKAAPSADAPNETAGRLKILTKPPPGYTAEARQRGISGTVRLSVLFAADGKVRYVIVLNKLSGGLTERAISAARKIEFMPETREGQPVSVVKTIEYSFKIF